MDIQFVDVSYIELPCKMNKVETLETVQEDIDYIAKRIGKTEKNTLKHCEEVEKYFL